MIERKPTKRPDECDWTARPADGADTPSRAAATMMMASLLAHDLVQPLTAALNYLEASRQELVDGDEVEGVTMIDQAIGQTLKAIDLIRRLRGFVLDGEVRRGRESLRDMVDQVSADLIIEGRYQAQVTNLIGASADLVLADRIQVELVLKTLMAEAIDAVAGHAERHVRIFSRHLGDEIEFRIGDSIPRLGRQVDWDRFEPAVVTTRLSGADLGLPICHAIVEAHGGRLWAERSEAGGTAFCLTLPAAERTKPERKACNDPV